MTAVAQIRRPQVGLFATCLVDLFRPSVGRASAKLIEDAGCDVIVPLAQTCCGQPGYNSGDRKDTRATAEQVIEAFEGFDYIVAPSGSCATMLKRHYPALFKGDAEWGARANAFAAKTHELVTFLADVMTVAAIKADYLGTVTYHDCCAGLRELDIKGQPRRLLASIGGLELREMKNSDTCCGVGGHFCAGHADAPLKSAAGKAADIDATGADLLLAGDMGCLMHMAGKLSRSGSTVEIRHIAEVLAGSTDTAPIAGRKR